MSRRDEVLSLLELKNTGEGGRVEAEPRLIRALHDEGDRARVALDVLGHWCEFHGHKVTQEVFHRALTLCGSDDAKLRAEACASLVLLRPEPTPPPGMVRAELEVRLRDPDPGVRQEAAAALGDLGDSKSQPALQVRLEDEHPGVRLEAAFALACLGDRSARDPLEVFLDHRELRPVALEGLRRLADPAALSALDRIRRSWLLPWADRTLAEAVAVRLGDPDGATALMKQAERGRFEQKVYALHLLAEERVEQAAPLMWRIVAESRDASLRSAAISALSALGQPKYLEHLKALAAAPETDEELRRELWSAVTSTQRTAP
ncbi:MAG: HEAT repeat domain-containing protein [Myxococcota bacterium]